jgi:hypothetical protein
MSKRYKPGDYLISCDLTGRKVLASTSKKDYRGNIVSPVAYLKRNPQDFVRAINDGKPVPVVRENITNSPFLLYPNTIGATSVPTPVGPASHLFNQGIGDMVIGSTFIVR